MSHETNQSTNQSTNQPTTRFEKKELLESLRRGEKTVTFQKVDGTKRRMRCTRSRVLVPESEFRKIAANSGTRLGAEDLPTEGKSLRAADNPNIVSVWDLDNQAWRSFRVDSVLSLE